ncbi:hypothetical protein CY658_21770 [Variovorax sp. RO1]|nr:hypothetical protein CY658_21770 [Variovorax sp. RO1]
MLFSVLSATGVPAPAQTAVPTFEVKGLNLNVKQDALAGLATGTSAFKCSPDRQNYLTTVCESNLEVRTCAVKKSGLPQGMWQQFQDCTTTYLPASSLTPAMQRMATIGGNQVKLIRISFFDAQASEIIVFHEGKNPGTFLEAFTQRYGPPTSEVANARDSYDNGITWTRADETMKLGAARVVLTNPSVLTARRQRLEADREAAKNRANGAREDAAKKAKSDI